MNISYSSDEYDDCDDYEQYIGKSSKCKQHINNVSVTKNNFVRNPKKEKIKPTQKINKPIQKINKPIQNNNKESQSIIKEKKVIKSNIPLEETVIDDWEDLL